MTGGFRGDVAEYYARYRRGYPPSVLAALVHALRLSSADTVIDVGCGTGQLSLPLAATVGHVVGVDPEADMLRHAALAAQRDSVGNVRWMLATARDVGTIAAEYGGVGAVFLANAIHLVERPQLFADAKDALRPGRGLAIIANGTPLWLQDNPWSRALHAFLEDWLGTGLTGHCGTDEASRAVYRRELSALAYAVQEVRVDYTENLSLEQIVGGVYSAMSERIPAVAERARFSSELGRALAGTEPYAERVQVRALIAHIR